MVLGLIFLSLVLMVLVPALPDGFATDFGDSCTGSDGFSTILQGLEKSVICSDGSGPWLNGSCTGYDGSGPGPDGSVTT